MRRGAIFTVPDVLATLGLAWSSARASTLAAVLAIALAAPNAARASAQPDCTDIAGVVDDFMTAFAERDADAIVGAMPPDYLRAHADRVGIGPETYRGIVVTMTRAALAAGAMEELEFDTGAVSCRATRDGRSYGLVPTRSMAWKNGALFEIRAETLALRDAGRWWLIQTNDDNQISVLREVYPAFEDVSFAPPRRTALE